MNRKEEIEKFLTTPISSFPFSTTFFCVAFQHKMETMGDLLRYSYTELRQQEKFTFPLRYELLRILTKYGMEECLKVD